MTIMSTTAVVGTGHISHIVCAKCGHDNVISNTKTSDGTLYAEVHSTTKYIHSVVLYFTCQKCNEHYPLPAMFMISVPHNEADAYDD